VGNTGSDSALREACWAGGGRVLSLQQRVETLPGRAGSPRLERLDKGTVLVLGEAGCIILLVLRGTVAAETNEGTQLLEPGTVAAKPPGMRLAARAVAEAELLLLEAHACPALEPVVYAPPYTVEAAPYTLAAGRSPQLEDPAHALLLAPVPRSDGSHVWVVVGYEDPGPPA